MKREKDDKDNDDDEAAEAAAPTDGFMADTKIVEREEKVHLMISIHLP